jgi:hypothetical protein
MTMPRKPKAQPDHPDQFKRFQEAAEKHGVDTSKAALDRALVKIVPAKKGPKRRP